MSSASQLLFGSIQGGDTLEGTDIIFCDPYWNNVNLLLLFNEAEGTPVNVIDSSQQNLTVGTTGDASIVSGGVHGNQALLPENPNLDHGFHAQSSGELDIRSGDFTIEAAITPTSYGTDGLGYIFYARELTNDGRGWSLQSNNDGLLFASIFAAPNNAISVVSPVNTIPLNTTSKIAFVRSGSDFLLFADGNLVASNSFSGTIADPGHDSIYIGYSQNSAYDNGVRQFYGNMDEVRLTKGVARYTANYTPIGYEPPTMSCS